MDDVVNLVSSFRSELGFYNRWLLISLCAHMEIIRHFDMLKAFDYIERVIKSDFFSEKDLVYIIRAQRKMSNHLI